MKGEVNAEKNEKKNDALLQLQRNTHTEQSLHVQKYATFDFDTSR